jgi:ribosome-associated toxin RatA of RatAB toxin-antitoxin module
VQTANWTHSISARPEAVWAAVTDQGSWAGQIEDLRGMEVLEADGLRRVLKLSAWLKGFAVEWQEERQLDPERRRFEFRQTEGMFAWYRGHWQITASGAGTDIEVRLEFESGIPHLGQFIDPVIAAAYGAFGRAMLVALERQCLAASATAAAGGHPVEGPGPQPNAQQDAA